MSREVVSDTFLSGEPVVNHGADTPATRITSGVDVLAAISDIPRLNSRSFRAVKQFVISPSGDDSHMSELSNRLIAA